MPPGDRARYRLTGAPGGGTRRDAGASLRPVAALGALGALATLFAFYAFAGLAMSGWSPGSRATVGYDVVGTLPPWIAGALFGAAAGSGVHRLRARWGEQPRPLAAALVGLAAAAGLVLSGWAAWVSATVLGARDLPGRVPAVALVPGALATLVVAAASFVAFTRTVPRLWAVGRLMLSAVVAAGSATALMLWWQSTDQRRGRDRVRAGRDSVSTVVGPRPAAPPGDSSRR